MRLLKKSTLLRFFVLLFSICMVSFSVAVFANAAEIVGDVTLDFKIEEKYVVGQSLTLPDGVISGKKADCYVIFPDGTKKSTKDISFSRPGKYTVIYSLNADGKTLEEKIDLFAYEKRYSSSSASDLTEYREAMEFSVDKNGNKATAAGIFSDLSEGSTFRYNGVVDLSNATKNDKVFSCNIVATEPTYCDFWQLVVRFTDAYDSANYVDVILEHNGDDSNHDNDVGLDGINYVRAGASNQVPSAYCARENSYLVGKYGNYAYVSMMSDAKNGNALTDTFDIYFDYKEKIVYGPQKEMTGLNMICDLDDPIFFGENLWSGFTTGECYISVFAKNYRTAKGGIFIREIFGETADDLSRELIEETHTPVIDVDFGEYNESALPDAVAGNPYPVFTATAKNLNYYCSDVSAKVYFKYNSATPVITGIRNGKFTPTIPGVYTVEYSVKDGFGKETKRTVDVRCVSASRSLKVTPAADRITETATGSLTKVADYVCENQSGRVNVEIKAVCGELVYYIDDSLTFRPLVNGEYDITYTAEDFAGQRDSASYKLTVTAGDNPVFIDGVYLPKYFVAGYNHLLPSLNAYDYKNGGNAVEADIYVKEGGNDERKIDGTYKPVLPSDGEGYSLKIIYRAKGKFGIGEVVYERPCYSVFRGSSSDYIEKNKLFIVDEGIERGYTAKNYADYADYTTNESSKSMTYINPVPANAFSFEYNMIRDKANFNRLDLLLSDSVNGTAVKLSIENRDADSVYVSVNDSTKIAINGTSFDSISKNVNITYSNTDKQFVFDYINVFNVKTDVNGVAFNGFDSGLVYLTVKFEGVSGESGIVVRKIANQQLLDFGDDATEPILVLNGAYKANYDINEEVSVVDVTCADMIMPYIAKSLTIYAPDGSVVYSGDNVKLQNVDVDGSYSFILSQYGQYKISYTVEGYKDPANFLIDVVDRAAPELSVAENFKTSYSLGTKISLAVSVRDNISDDCKVFVCVERPDGRIFYETNSEYTFNMKGKYRIIFNAMDQRGNTSQKIYVVNVR